MLFNSYNYIFYFVPIVVCAYFVLRSKIGIRGGKLWLVCASLFFYAMYDVNGMIVFLLLICINYVIGEYARKKKQKGYLLIGIAMNIGVHVSS